MIQTRRHPKDDAYVVNWHDQFLIVLDGVDCLVQPYGNFIPGKIVGAKVSPQ